MDNILSKDPHGPPSQYIIVLLIGKVFLSDEVDGHYGIYIQSSVKMY